ncbi:MAG: SH3 domain-containing protein [Acidobacteriia bacterium]|nr:SH3 domain-containing protein [Terriglobia bacterium]
MIRGTKEYNKDEFVSGAEVATSTPVFPAWTEGGKVFYKVRLNALDPRNFKDSGDVGTLAVRYVVQGQDEKHTVLRIDAIFVEDFRHVAHASNGSVETAEYKDIHDHLDSLALMKTEAAESEKAKQESSSRKQEVALRDETSGPSNPLPPSPIVDQPSPTSPQSQEPTPPVSIEQRVHNLRQQVQRIVKAPGAPLKSAPFHSASTLQALPSGAEVLIVITTPYWFGVETHDGQHGWILRDELEMLP